MQRYWTPLARVLGLYGDTESPRPDAPAPLPPEDQRLATHWPQLFEAFRRHALEEWVPACKRHAEVSPQDKMAVHSLAITPHDPLIAGQLAHWQREGSTQDLVRWLVQGPWNLPEVHHWVDFSGLDAITVQAAPEAPATTEPASRFDWRQQPQAQAPAPSRVWTLHAQTSWVERTHTIEPPPEPQVSDWQLTLHDAKPARQVRLTFGLTILGQEKTVRMPDGTTQALKDQASMAWEDQHAVYHAVQGALASGLHLALRVSDDGLACRDLGSTNGTYLGGQRLAPETWTACPVGTRLSLGGPATDLRSQAPSLEVSRAQAGRPVPLGATPLRPLEDSALLQIQPGAGGDAIAVKHLPFTIGRDPRCHWVIGAEHAMVSRHHLVIEEIDPASKRLRVRDLSAQGLTQCEGLTAESLRAGQWIPLGSTLALGASAPYPGMKFSLG